MRTFSAITGCCLLLAGCGSADPPRSSAPPSTAASASPSPSRSPSVSVPAAPRDGTNLKACADASCEVIIKGLSRVAMAKKFRIAEIGLIQSSGRLELYVDR